MQPTQKLSRLLRGLLALVNEEADRNPDFAARLAELLEESGNKERTTHAKPSATDDPVPDVFALYQDKGDEEFRFSLRAFDLATLKRIVRANGFDPGKTTRKWTDPDKYVALIADQTAARLRRGSSFLPPRVDAKNDSDE